MKIGLPDIIWGDRFEKGAKLKTLRPRFFIRFISQRNIFVKLGTNGTGLPYVGKRKQQRRLVS